MADAAKVWMAVRFDLRRVAEKEGRDPGVAPSAIFYRKHGRFSCYRIQRALGPLAYTKRGDSRPSVGWKAAMRRLGFIPCGSLRRATRAQVVDDLRRVAELCGRDRLDLPTIDEYRTHGRYCPRTAIERASHDDTWWGLSEGTGMTPATAVPYGSLTEEKLLADYRRCCEESGFERGGYGLGRHLFDKMVPYSPANVQLRWGSWNGFVEAAGFRPRPVGGRRVHEAGE